MDVVLDYLIVEGEETGAAKVNKKSLSDPDLQKKLFIEFGLDEKS